MIVRTHTQENPVVLLQANQVVASDAAPAHVRRER